MIVLSTEEAFSLGAAYASFSYGDIDAGVHYILPGTDSVTREESNFVFADLCDSFQEINPILVDWSDRPGDHWMKIVVAWANSHGIEIGS